MADKNAIYHDVENSDSSENLSHDEWTIISENCSEKDDTDGGNNIANGINGDQDLSSRGMEVISKPDEDTMANDAGSIIIEKHDEDSDGISVITESEPEQLVANKKFGEIDGCKNRVLGALKIYEKTGEKTAPQVGTILNVVIACSLAAIIGLGAGRILGMDDKCPVTSAIDFPTIKMESDNLIDRIKELSEVKDVLDEIKASLPKVNRNQEKTSQRGSKSKSKSKGFERRDKTTKIPDTYSFDPDTTILEQLQTSLNTLCSVIDGMNPENDFIKSDTSRTQGVVADLITFKEIIYSVIKEIEDTDRPKEMQFLRHAEKRIRDVCESLLSDLSYTVHGLTMKIHHKLNKVRHKLNKKLCLLKNSESVDGRIFQSLEENNSFLESCDKILNVTLKASKQSVKTEQKQESKKKSSSKTKKRSPKKSASESENDSYPRDSSSDSSMPDLAYKTKDGDIWRHKQVLQEAKKETKEKSGEILLQNDSSHRKIGDTKSMKSSRRRSLKKSMIEVLVPADSCPLAQEHQMELESVYPETQRFKVPILESKPLYSTILKSVINVTSAINNSSGAEKLSGKQTLENTRAAVDTITNEQTDEEFVPEVKKDLTEKRHNVTPVESGINVQTMESMKEEQNTKIRQPIRKYNEVSQEKDILAGKREDFEQLENIARVPSSAGFLKHCQKGKKCAFKDSTVSPESNKASATSHTDSIRHKRSSNEKIGNKRPIKTRNYDGKKPKKAKHEEKFSLREEGFKKPKDNQKINDQLTDDWQSQRSRAREMHRDHNHRSEWFFDRANFRQDARKNTDGVQNTKSRAHREFYFSGLSRYQPCKYYRKDKCAPICEGEIHDEESYDYWQNSKDMNDRKHSISRAGFIAKKMLKMPHRKNIAQSKRH